MKILLWHVHGSWTTSFVQGCHDYLLPVVPDRGPDGRGRAATWTWPDAAVERTPEELADESFDVVVLQRPHEAELVERWTGRRPGRDVPAVYVEHNTPGDRVPYTRHPMADQTAVPVAHVTHTNRVLWDTGAAPTTVVEHGVVDPGDRWSGELERAAVVVNDPVRRGRAVGADLVPAIAREVPVDVLGMGAGELRDAVAADDAELGSRVGAHDDLPQDTMHAELARRRVYVHTARWTSLGLSLIEAMHLGMPVVALAATEVPRAVPPGTGLVTADLDALPGLVRRLVDDPDEARALGRRGREHALAAYGLDRFLRDWDALLERVCR